MLVLCGCDLMQLLQDSFITKYTILFAHQYTVFSEYSGLSYERCYARQSENLVASSGYNFVYLESMSSK